MAEVIPTDVDHDANKPKKQGKLFVFKFFITIKEVAALRAHVAAYGTIREKLENLTLRVNQSSSVTSAEPWKSVQNRYKCLQGSFNKNEFRNSALSGVAEKKLKELY